MNKKIQQLRMSKNNNKLKHKHLYSTFANSSTDAAEATRRTKNGIASWYIMV